MNRRIVFLWLMFISCGMYAQPNCEILKDDEHCYTSCKTAWRAIKYKQGSFKSQQLFDKSIGLCPGFSYSYREKAVPFLKRGQYVEWKRLIDKAVAISPSENLGYRGWCRLQFLRDYKGAIADIEELMRISNYDIGHCQTGDYHLEIALALCYKEIGELEKAKELLENRIQSENYSFDLYDYYHLGIIEFELGNIPQAIAAFHQQIENNEIAEPYFYLALVHKQMNEFDDYRSFLNKSEELYRQGNTMFDNYAENLDKIFLQDILDEKSTVTYKR
ncbi:MAG: hypothetical protein P1U56_18705 [Saprospiraceae bacterium]|nr:hypothetical protein [Saprospiraceae bacterium]